MTKKEAIYTIDGKPAKLRDVKSSALEEALRDYIPSREAHRVGIRPATLRSWRNRGKIWAKRIGTTWFYSRQDLLELLRESLSASSKGNKQDSAPFSPPQRFPPPLEPPKPLEQDWWRKHLVYPKPK